jgi:Kyakuja-Dileera-Zisupton transposase
MRYSMIFAMDGNESQRRNASNVTDPRQFDSELYLSEEYVDMFKDEVKRKRVRTSALFMIPLNVLIV